MIDEFIFDKNNFKVLLDEMQNFKKMKCSGNVNKKNSMQSDEGWTN